MTGDLESEALRARVHQLVRRCKDWCDRDAVKPVLVESADIEDVTGLPAGWVLAAVRSRLLERVCPDREMNVYWDGQSRALRIPATFQQRRAGRA